MIIEMSENNSKKTFTENVINFELNKDNHWRQTSMKSGGAE